MHISYMYSTQALPEAEAGCCEVVAGYVQARQFEWHEEHKHVLVQTYKDNQLQVHARRFYVR